MTIYRVGASGATVYDVDGLVVGHLRPGQVVVANIIETIVPQGDPDQAAAARPPEPPPLARTAPKRVKHYTDKRVRPTEDKTSA